MKSLCTKYGFNSTGRRTRLQLMRLDPPDCIFAKQLHEQILLPNIDQLIDDFYVYMLGEKQTLAFLKQHDINRLKNTQRHYIKTLGVDYASVTYFEQRLQIGLRHALIELPLSLYQCSYLYLQGLILKRIDLTENLDHKQKFDLSNFTLKIVSLDISLATDTYFSINLESLENSLLNLRSEKEALSTKVNFDMLTGISSRESIIGQAQNAFADSAQNGYKFSLIVADIDFFKHVNDTYGHAMGDEVLKKVATRMNNVIRGNDVIGRTGGEEFLIVLPQSDITAASAVGERIRKAIEESSISFNGNSINITTSLGAAELKDNENLEDLIERADQALYKAKETGRNRICLSEKADS